MFSLQSKRKNKLKVAHMIQGWNENNNDFFLYKDGYVPNYKFSGYESKGKRLQSNEIFEMSKLIV